MENEKLLRSSMAKRRKPRISEETAARVEAMYAQGDMTVREVAKACGISVASLYRILEKKGWK